MDPITHKAFEILLEAKQLHCATVEEGQPTVRVINLMLVEDDGLYFITGRGKPFYLGLKENPRLALSGMNQQFVAVRVIGDVEFCPGREVPDKIIEKNPGLGKLYKGETRSILDAFAMRRGKGEIFDLSADPLLRERFAFGGESVNPPGYFITEECTACGECLEACPVEVISEGEIYTIEGRACLECGNCAEACPVDAIEGAKGF